MISIVNTECHVPKTFSDLAKIAAWGRLGQFRTAGYSETHGSIFERAKHTRSTSTQVSARNLMNPDEIMRMGPDEQLLLIQGKDPLRVQKIRYYDQREFAGSFDQA